MIQNVIWKSDSDLQMFWTNFVFSTICWIFSQKLKHLRKQGSKASQTYGRQSPLHGDHTAIPASRLPQSIPISIPLAPRPSEGPQKRSLEGLNSEIQKLVLTDTQTERVSILCYLNHYLPGVIDRVDNVNFPTVKRLRALMFQAIALLRLKQRNCGLSLVSLYCCQFSWSTILIKNQVHCHTHPPTNTAPQFL